VSQFVLYRFFDGEGRLLYVGMTINPGRRMDRHRTAKEWWTEVVEIRMEQFPDLDTLRVAERAAIVAEKPRYNIRMNGAAEAPPAVGKLITAPIETLIGKWFHSYRAPLAGEDLRYTTVDGSGNVLEWQGQITGREGGMLICQLYSWMDGEPTNLQLVDLDDMLVWRFFATNVDMLCANGCPENSDRHRENPCGRPITRVIRDTFMGDIYRCGRCIEFYAGSETAQSV
jgi:hypothetical protein